MSLQNNSVSMIRKFVPSLALVLAMALAHVPTGPAEAQSAAEKSAMQSAQKFVNRAHSALSSGGSNAQKAKRMESAVRSSFSFPTWERFLLGKNASKFDSKQMAQFKKLLPKYLARLYVNNARGPGGSPPKIDTAKPSKRDILVSSSETRRKVQWRMRKSGGGYKIADFLVGGGSSFLVLKRAEFNASINKGGPDNLISFMERFIS